MSKQEVRNLFGGWRAILRRDFYEALLSDPVMGLKLVLSVLHAFLVEVVYLILVPPEVRKAR